MSPHPVNRMNPPSLPPSHNLQPNSLTLPQSPPYPRPLTARRMPGVALAALAALAVSCTPKPPQETAFQPLFPSDGIPAGWVVRAWNDVSKPAAGNPVWTVENGILRGGEPRGSWLMSERQYADFELEFEFKLGERGNSGCALRAPLAGDPAFDGLELQMADFRYNTDARPSELTGGLYRAVAPKQQVYQPTKWNHYRIRAVGPHISVHLNGIHILDVDLDAETDTVKRHDGTDAPPLRDRPRLGHIGFQELSRDAAHTEIRNARIRVLN
jgi:hypothetical protein